MIKTLKGKVVAGTVAVTLIAGSGIAFGASDAGTKLGNWFTGQLNLSKSELSTNVDNYVGEKTTVAMVEYNKMKTGASNSIDIGRETSTAVANSNIEKELKDHKAALAKKRKELEGYADTEFNKLFEAEKKKLHDLGVEAARQADADMSAHTSAEGKAALGTLNMELQETTNKAVADLEEAIRVAKSGLEEKLDSNVSTKTEDLKKIVDKEVSDLLIWTQFMTNYMVQEQTEAITAAAKKIEGEAKQAMQDAVNGI
ncbi:hypothetical protein [Psychrobacillus sp. NPDC096389]|uniref:hypothetical protein n=1 Tax=Psychrobacillus sp. NPDC096389 TaxID=3364490 RepID=UPI0037F452C5